MCVWYALWHFLDHVVNFRHFAGGDHVLEVGVRAGNGEVFVNGVGKEHGFLRYHAVGLA